MGEVFATVLLTGMVVTFLIKSENSYKIKKR